MEDALIEALVYQVVDLAKRADTGYKREAWVYAIAQVQAVAGSGQLITEKPCKNKHDAWKKDWKIYTALISKSGFSVDEDGVVVADPEALEEYFQAHPEARKFKKKAPHYRDEFAKLFEGSMATGQDSVTIERILESVEVEGSVPPSEGSPQPGQRKRSGTASVEQARGGQKRHNTAVDRLGQQLNGIARHFESLVATLERDPQSESISVLMRDFKVLHSSLRLKIARIFSEKFEAIAFIGLEPEMRKKWVLEALETRRESLAGVDFDGKGIDSIIESMEWSGGGVLKQKDRE